MCNKYSIGNYPPLRVKIEGLLLAFLLLTVSCESDRDAQGSGDGMAVELNIRTRAITSDSYTYEVGSTWENYIDIAGGDYRIYFFTNDKDDATATDDSGRNTLISEFQPFEVTDINGTDYTQYTLAGGVDKVMAGYSDFKIVVLANWGAYPTAIAGETTIDDLVEGDNSTFTAATFLTTDGVSSAHLIPFYGVREYSGVKWRQGWRTTLSGDITLLRALAKVEVILNAEDSDIEGFDSVSIVRYNTSGYCAPKGVYLRGDYDSGYTDWAGDFTNTIHLVGGSNSGVVGERRTHVFNRQTGTAADTWTIYLPEYDNLTGDCSYIQVTIDGTEYEIYFANYSDGVAANTADYDIYRNCLYRFTVTYVGAARIYVYVTKWNVIEEKLGPDDWGGGYTGGGSGGLE